MDTLGDAWDPTIPELDGFVLASDALIKDRGTARRVLLLAIMMNFGNVVVRRRD